jgi:UDP:flavonoid glycosyltransferase YjiC (YdhE family)
MGTGSVSLDRLEKVLPEVFPAGGKTICLVGAQSIEQFYRLGAVEFRPYIPASSVLPFCDWTLCHGGQNTIIQSLREGVPLLIFPGPIFERRINAKKVQMTGSGLMGEIDQFTPGWLRNAFSQQAGCTLRAAALSGRICSYGGPDAAVAAIHSLVAQ